MLSGPAHLGCDGSDVVRVPLEDVRRDAQRGFEEHCIEVQNPAIDLIELVAPSQRREKFVCTSRSNLGSALVCETGFTCREFLEVALPFQQREAWSNDPHSQPFARQVPVGRGVSVGLAKATIAVAEFPAAGTECLGENGYRCRLVQKPTMELNRK